MAEEHDNSERQIIKRLQESFQRTKAKTIVVLDRLTYDDITVAGDTLFLHIVFGMDNVAEAGLKLVNKQINTWKVNPFGNVMCAEWKDRARYGKYETEVFKCGNNVLWQVTNVDPGHVIKCYKTWKVSGFSYTASFNEIGRLVSLCKSVNSDDAVRRG